LITVLDADGIVTYQSPSIERVLGYSVEEVEGKRFDPLLSETDSPLLEPLISLDGTGEGEGPTIECSVRHRDGTALLFEVQHTDLLHDEHVRGIVPTVVTSASGRRSRISLRTRPSTTR